MVTTVQDMSWADAKVLEAINVWLSIPSFLGSLFVLICYWKFRELRNFAFHMVSCMALSDLFFSVANLLGDTHNPHTWMGASHTLCGVQAAMISYFQLASLLWAVMIAFCLYMVYIRLDDRFAASAVRQWKIHFHALCWVSLFIAGK